LPRATATIGRRSGVRARQTFPDWECLLVDDGSRDQTQQVVRPFLADSRFRCIRSDSLGQPRAKNLALRLSSAPLVAYLDGDDIWLPSKLERQLRLMEADNRIGVCFTRRFIVNPEEQYSSNTRTSCAA
jgi:glycosyltransferase involved in cell wall biosynthesis